MTFASRSLRRLELALWAIGISLLGGALGATYDRWSYQAQQERALFQSLAVERAADPLEGSRRVPVAATAGPTGPAAFVGPQRPAVLDAPVERREVPVAPPPTIVRKTPPAVDPGVFGRIEIPRIGVRAIVREGADEKTLARAVGLVPGGAQPGQSGNIVLAGHRDTFFRPLRRIELNDRIRVRVAGDETYEYRVDEVRVVSPEETSVLQSRGVEELTLVTCYPFRFIGPAPDRFIVKATRVN
jgi:sortase A